VTALASDPSLRSRVELAVLNTAPDGEKVPGAFDLTNIRLTVLHVARIYRQALSADVVHLNLAPAPLLPLVRAIALSLAARAAGARVILHAHTGLLETAVDGALYRILLRLGRRVVDEFLVVSSKGVDALRAAGIPTTLLRNGIDVGRYPARTEAAPRDPPIVLFVGTVCERKGVLELRDATAELLRRDPPVRFHLRLVGDAAQEGPRTFERIKGLYERSGLENVTFLGALDHRAVDRELTAASIFCLPSHYEAFPLAVLEAMAAETAVVATAVGDIPDMLRGDAGVLIRPRSSSDLAGALARLIDDPKERQRVARAARLQVEREYGWDQMIRTLHAFYTRLTPPGEPDRLEQGCGQPSGRTA
jgi:glycosyltransferase involved in cell wall biosynthesis